MQAQLARLHARGDGTAAPTTVAELEELAQVLGVPLPPAVRAIYEDHGAEEPHVELCLRRRRLRRRATCRSRIQDRSRRDEFGALLAQRGVVL